MKTIRLRIPRFAAFLAAFSSLLAVAFAQSVPNVPCCIDFNNPDQGGISGTAVSELEIRYPGPSGDPADGYLHAHDASGGSYARLMDPNDGTPSCFGNWKELLGPGRCLELCWDVNLLTDGDNSQVIAKPARITIFSGSLRATFRTFLNITEQGGPNNGWYTFCAPVALSNADGTLPSNADGEWLMNDANGDPAPASDWDQLLCNVDQIAFFVDYHSSISEEWCWDNVCLQEGECPDCMDVTNGRWECQIDPVGGRQLKYIFDVTNNSQWTAHVGLVPDPTGFTVTPNTWDFVPDLDPGQTDTVTLCIDGAKAGEEICFEFVLFNHQEGECCREEICVKVPCVKIEQESVVCSPVAGGGAVYSFILTNISGGSAEYAYLLSKDPGVVIDPALIPLGGLADGASSSIGPVNVIGAAPNEELCFCVVLLDRELRECCIQEHCVLMPDCEPSDVQPDGNGRQVEPCDPTDPMVVTSPDGCFCICSESIVCDPDQPDCHFYSFTVTNKSESVMDHILIPDPNVSPSQVIFPDPLKPGEAARVRVKITGQQPGPFIVPMVLVSLEDCVCCHLQHEIELPPCDCVQVLAEKLECKGRDPVTGLFCYTYCATIQNLTGETLEELFLFPEDGNPNGIEFRPEHLPLGGLAPNAITTVVTTIKIPDGVKDIHFHISVHNEDFEECCAIQRWLHVPDCCDCEETVVFEFDPTVPPGELPEGVSLINLERDPNTGKVGFPADGDVSPFPFVYMAASGRGTIVRIDANTGVVLGEYRSSPQTNTSPNPSRTTVDQFGECWLGNRSNQIPPVGMGSVMRVGLILGGTRGDRTGPIGGPYVFTPNPAGEYLQGPFSYVSPSVVDRDGDGLIRTSTGLGNILDWDAPLSGGNDPGGVTLADDECIVNFVRVPDACPRALAIDSNNDLWVGGTCSSIFQQIDGGTGLPGITRTIAGGYGGLIDGNEVLWSVGNGAGLYRHDLLANTTTFTPVPGAYGIGINPCDGYIWVSGRQFPSAFLNRVDPAGAVVGTWPQPGMAQGLSVDRNGDVWVSGGSLWRFDGAGTLLNTLPVYSTGNAIDHNGNVWASAIGANAAQPVITGGIPVLGVPVPLGAGAGPYNYSDMTGYVTLGASGQTGIMLFTHDSLCPGTEWGRVTWQSIGEVADLCGITAEVRASDDPLNYPATWTAVGSGISFCPQAGILGVVGQYIQVRLIFTRPAGCPPECDPKLCWLTVECCDAFGVGPANPGPVVEISDPIALPNVPAPATVVVGAHVFDPNGDRMHASWSVDGRIVATTAVDGDDIIELTHEFDDGISEVVLTVRDDQNTTVASTTVMIGDHLPPVIVCNSGEFAGGDLRVAAFEATIPDVVSLSSATDNVTPASELQLTQDPPAGTVVGQGTHTITVSTTDAAGNTGTCTVYLIVEQVASPTGFANYETIEEGEPIAVGANFHVPDSEVAETVVLVDGEVVATIAGPLVEPVDLHLGAGEHAVVLVVTSVNGVQSRTSVRVIRVLPMPSPPRFGRNPMALRWESPAKDALIVEFDAPAGVQCCVQRTDSLIGDWDTIHVVDGAGQRVEYRYVVEPRPGFGRCFFRLLYLTPKP